MGTERTTKNAKPKRSAKKTAARPRVKAKAKARVTSARRSARPTLATISTQLEKLTEQVAVLTELLRAPSPPPPARGGKVNGSAPKIETADFDAELLATVAELDRSARHGGMVPIPDVRRSFLERGWSRDAFDDRLLQAERDFIVDLKAANDPSRLAEPHLAIQEPGRGHLQYVVTR